MTTIRTLDGGTRTETMPDSRSAHEPPANDGTQATMSLREIAEEFVKHEDADVVGVIHRLLELQKEIIFKDYLVSPSVTIHSIATRIIDFVEAQNEG